MPPKRKHGHERDATKLASSGSIPTKVAPKPHATAPVWCVRRCAMKGSIFSATPPLEAQRVSLCVLCVRKTFFFVEDPLLISIADVSRAHFLADAARDVYVQMPDEDPKGKGARRMRTSTNDDVQIFGCCSTVGRTPRPGLGDGRIYPRRGLSVQFPP